jgi:hypothetical protein
MSAVQPAYHANQDEIRFVNHRRRGFGRRKNSCIAVVGIEI